MLCLTQLLITRLPENPDAIPIKRIREHKLKNFINFFVFEKQELDANKGEQKCIFISLNYFFKGIMIHATIMF